MLFVLTGLRAADPGPKPPANPAPAPAQLAAQVQRAIESPLPPQRLTAEEILRRFDQNGDGKLDDEEREAAHEAMMKEQEQRRTAAAGKFGAARNQIRAQLLRRFDRNGDGKIDDTEWAELEPILRARIENAPLQLRRYDRNGDGRIDDAEWALATVQIRRWLNEPPAAEVK